MSTSLSNARRFRIQRITKSRVIAATRICICMNVCIRWTKRGLIRGMQAHKNSTPLGIHTRRRASCRVASMRCSATAFKKGKQKLHHRAPVSLRLGSPLKSTTLPYSLFHSLSHVRLYKNYMRWNALSARISERGNRASSRSKPKLPVRRLYAADFEVQMLENDTAVN